MAQVPWIKGRVCFCRRPSKQFPGKGLEQITWSEAARLQPKSRAKATRNSDGLQQEPSEPCSKPPDTYSDSVCSRLRIDAIDSTLATVADTLRRCREASRANILVSRGCSFFSAR